MNQDSKENIEPTPSWQKSENGVKRIFQALGYSVAGFKAAYKKEAAFRQLIILCLVLLPFAIFLHVTRVERVLLLGVLLLSLLVEMFNSAIEATVD
ncbi:UNVERIFIED_CONTAM: hypothetical protein GTU68_020894, partial [Idotea baltica]|nr:hypothetical protein [Idotea baltica]